MRIILLFGAFLGASLGLWSGCLVRKSPPEVNPKATAPASVTGVRVETGTLIRVALKSGIAVRTARPGDAWEGRLEEDAVVFRAVIRTSGSGESTSAGPTPDDVFVLDRVVIPAGSHVTGVVTAAPEGPRGPGALPALAVKAIDLKGRTLSINASAGQVVAGSSRARGPHVPAGSPNAIVLRFTVNEIGDVQ
jgi:hypothetical protein